MQGKQPLQPSDLLRKAKAEEILADLKNYFKDRPFIISDVRDGAGHQYADLVQEGGGVLGIALVGYTYILEKMGIRFFSLAGTSAGSINAMLLACCGNKEDEKTEKIIGHFLKLDFFAIVDGKKSNWRFTKFIKKGIQRFIGKKGFIKNVSRIAIGVLLTFVLLTIGAIILAFIAPLVAKWMGFAAGLILLTIILTFLFFKTKFKQFAADGYGLNEGVFFHKWINTAIATNHVENEENQNAITTLADFSKHFMRIPKLTVTPDSRRPDNDPPHMPILTIIASEIIAERKIEFPAMWDLYWKHPEDVRPGDFVRASMSIPVFFETYTVTDTDRNSSFEIWQKHLNWQNADKKIPYKAQFIDGGVLSNFPINVFYNPNYPVPRMPTFGIRLQDGVLDSNSAADKTFTGYLASMFNTIRFNFDRDFITKNRAYNKGVKAVDVQSHSWLNFFMEDGEKIKLFEKGARAAANFLKAFNWEEYKTERLKNFEMGVEKFDDPNNLKERPYTGEKS
ncbi:MAG: patatin-like phospholipase family protein [Bacteroidota bacterium]